MYISVAVNSLIRGRRTTEERLRTRGEMFAQDSRLVDNIDHELIVKDLIPRDTGISQRI